MLSHAPAAGTAGKYSLHGVFDPARVEEILGAPQGHVDAMFVKASVSGCCGMAVSCHDMSD